MIRHLHPLAGAGALAVIVVFWLTTVAVELFGDPAAVTLVKRSVAWGLLALLPVIAVTVVTGKILRRGNRHPLVAAKDRRMILIGLIGMLVLVPAALYLAMSATAGTFDTTFFVVQGVELAAGVVNAALLFLNLRDGKRLTAGRQTRATLFT